MIPGTKKEGRETTGRGAEKKGKKSGEKIEKNPMGNLSSDF